MTSTFTQELRDKLISQISELGKREGRERDRKLKELLTKSFPVIKIKALRPVVMCILKHMSHVEDKYLKILVSVAVLEGVVMLHPAMFPVIFSSYF